MDDQAADRNFVALRGLLKEYILDNRININNLTDLLTLAAPQSKYGLLINLPNGNYETALWSAARRRESFHYQFMVKRMLDGMTSHQRFNLLALPAGDERWTVLHHIVFKPNIEALDVTKYLLDGLDGEQQRTLILMTSVHGETVLSLAYRFSPTERIPNHLLDCLQGRPGAGARAEQAVLPPAYDEQNPFNPHDGRPDPVDREVAEYLQDHEIQLAPGFPMQGQEASKWQTTNLSDGNPMRDPLHHLDECDQLENEKRKSDKADKETTVQYRVIVVEKRSNHCSISNDKPPISDGRGNGASSNILAVDDSKKKLKELQAKYAELLQRCDQLEKEKNNRFQDMSAI